MDVTLLVLCGPVSRVSPPDSGDRTCPSLSLTPSLMSAGGLVAFFVQRARAHENDEMEKHPIQEESIAEISSK